MVGAAVRTRQRKMERPSRGGRNHSRIQEEGGDERVPWIENGIIIIVVAIVQ